LPATPAIQEKLLSGALLQFWVAHGVILKVVFNYLGCSRLFVAGVAFFVLKVKITPANKL
jgi:hypothetical protein